MNIKSTIKEEIDNQILTEVEIELRELLSEQYNTPDDSSTSNLPYFGDPMWNLNEDSLNERDDMPKILAANKVVYDIEQKIKNNDYAQIIPKSDSAFGMNMVIVVVEYKGIKLELNFTDKKNENMNAGYGYLEAKNPMITIFNCNIVIKYQHVELVYRKRALYHEVIHFLDDMIDKHKISSYDNDNMDLNNPEKSKIYYNSPEEFNAHTLQIFKAYMQDVGSYKNIPADFKSVRNGIFAAHRPQYGGVDPKHFYSKLTPENQKKFLNRMYAFYHTLQEFKKKKEEQENLKQPITEEDYRGDHRAPNVNDSPLHDVTLNGTYPDDIYTDNKALRYYGDGYYYDAKALAIVLGYHNKPNRQVKIYRAVPKVITTQEKIADYEKQMAYIMKYGRIPSDVNNWGNKSEYYEFLSKEIEKLRNNSPQQEEKTKINNGDWVGITLEYVKEHGEGQFGRGKYRVLTKVVPAKHVFTEGNSLQEWGYDTSINETIERPVLSEETYKVYHGTNEKFSNFNFKNATQGIVWFTDNIDSIRNGEHGGQGNKYVMTRYITINKPAGWAEYEKYGLGQLESMGYDGVILPQGDKTDYFVFSPKSISAKPPVKFRDS